MKVTAAVLASFAAMACASPLAKRQGYPYTADIDDGDSFFTYSSSNEWTHLTNQGDIVHDGTLSYSKAADASYSFSAANPANLLNLTIYAGKKNDRGSFDVYLDGDWIGSGSAYDANASEATKPQVVFKKDSIDTTNKNTITVKNNQGAGPTLAIDYVNIKHNLYPY